MDGHINSILSHHHMMDYGTGTSRAKELTPPTDESESSNTTCTTYTVPPSQVVELATLTVPEKNDSSVKCNNTKTVILHTSKETAYALEAADVDVEANTNAYIQAVVDMEKLSQLAHATDDEFVGGLHREANDQAFQPPSIIDSFFMESAVEQDDQSFKPPSRMNSLFEEGEEKQQEFDDDDTGTPLLVTSSNTTSSVHSINISCTDAVMDIEQQHTLELNIDMDDFMSDNVGTTINTATTSATTTTDDDVRVGHDAFLLEFPKKQGEEEHHFVLALQQSQADANGDGYVDVDVDVDVDFDIDVDVDADVDVDVDDGNFFPMLEKTMSILSEHLMLTLPTDIQDVQLEATTVPAADHKVGEEQLHLELKIKRQVPVVGYAILFCGFFALACTGAALELQGPKVSAPMKTYWRMISTALLIFPVVAIKVSRHGLPKLARKEWLCVVAAAFCYAQMCTVFVIALAMTSLPDAFVFANMTSLVIIVAKIIMGLPVLLLEASGAVIGIAGGIIVSRDTTFTTENGDNKYPDAFLGNLIALSASFGTALYLAVARDLRSKCDLYVFMWIIFTFASFFILVYMIVTNEPVEFSRHPDHGLFGWLNLTHDRLPLELFMAAVINLIGTIGYISLLKYFDAVVISVIMLMEPVAGVFIGYMVGVGSLPGTQTWVGDAIVTLGSGMVVYSGSTKTESIDATQAIRSRSDTNNNIYRRRKQSTEQSV